MTPIHDTYRERELQEIDVYCSVTTHPTMRHMSVVEINTTELDKLIGKAS